MFVRGIPTPSPAARQAPGEADLVRQGGGPHRRPVGQRPAPCRSAPSSPCAGGRPAEDRIRCGKDTGLGRFPSRTFAINAAWLTVVMLAVDLLVWAQTLLLHDIPKLAKAEPKTLRYRLLRVAARLVRGGRRLRLRLDATWPWATQLAAAFHRCATLPQPAR